MNLEFLSACATLLGWGLFFWASLFRRRKSAPVIGSTGFVWPPWGRREWFTPNGYRARVVGSILVGLSVIDSIVRVIRHYS